MNEKYQRPSERSDKRSSTFERSTPRSSTSGRFSSPGDRFTSSRSARTSESTRDARPIRDSTTPDFEPDQGRPPRRDSAYRSEERRQEPVGDVEVPDVPRVPRTTAASEFIYGINSVIAALRAGRRHIYKLYTCKSDNAAPPKRPHGSSMTWRQPAPAVSRERVDAVSALARERNVPITVLEENSVSVLYKMSDNRPHNGVVLECSALPFPPVAELGGIDESTATVPLTFDKQSAEDAEINSRALSPNNTLSVTVPSSTRPEQTTTVQTWRYPLIVMLDGILDEGNLGNIIRSAHFYGVDGVAICTNTCAPLSSAVTLKAASGAAEALPLLRILFPSNFVTQSAKAGWKIFAAVAPDEASEQSDDKEDGGKKSKSKSLNTWDMTTPLAEGPAILMLGSEGSGLRRNLRRQANANVYIKGNGDPSRTDVGVDSMNVSSAAAVLIDAFLRKPVSAGFGGSQSATGTESPNRVF